MKPFYILVSFITFSCTNKIKTTNSLSPGSYIKTPSGLMYTILKKGTGEKAKEGQEVLKFETTTYLNGTILYSNENSTTPVKVFNRRTTGNQRCR